MYINEIKKALNSFNPANIEKVVNGKEGTAIMELKANVAGMITLDIY